MSDDPDRQERPAPASPEAASPTMSAEGTGPVPAARPSPDAPPDGAEPESGGAEPESAGAEPESAEAEPRPAERRGWRRRIVIGVGAVVGVITLSVVLGVGLFAASVAYAQYGAVKDGPNAEAWRSVTPRFAGAAACTTCHEPQATAQDASAHIEVSCEACHGAGAAHAASDSEAEAHQLLLPPSRTCIRCHGTTPGRPADFRQVDPARHYSGGACLRCHDPHSIVAVRPPEVSHPLADLPVCITCHAPDGLKKIPAGHELVPDATCLACHGPKASGTGR